MTEEIAEYEVKDEEVVKTMRDGKYTEEIGDIMISLVAEGKTYPEVCKAAGISIRSLMYWLNPTSIYFKQEFADLFVVAYKFGADVLEGKGHAEAMDDSNDLYEDIDKDGNIIMRPNTANVQRSRLKAESYIRMAGHRNSLKFGRVERALQAGRGDITVQIINYNERNSDKAQLPTPKEGQAKVIDVDTESKE